MARHINDKMRKMQNTIQSLTEVLHEYDKTIVDIESNHSMYHSYLDDIHGNRMARSKNVLLCIQKYHTIIAGMEEAIAAHKARQIELSTVRRDNKNLRGSLKYYINKEREEENAKLGYERSIRGRIKERIKKIRRIYTGN